MDRQTYWTLTTQNSATLIADIVEIFMQEVSTIKDADAVLPSISFQPIGTDMISHFSKNGENALGISAADGPLNRLSPFSFPSDSFSPTNFFKLSISWYRGPTKQMMRG